MKKSLLTLFFLLFASSQAQEPEILKRASELYDANYNMDFESIAGFTYPEAVEQLGGKQKFISKIDADYQNPEFRKRLQLTAPVFQVGPVKSIGSKKFCLISFRNPTRYFYEEKLSPGEMNEQVIKWKQVASTKEVFGEPNRNSINVKRISKFVAVSDASTNGQWKFFNFDDLQQLEIFNSHFATEKVQLGL
ncbi:hypothetical protein HC229_08475 [Flavobacterium sp. D33]|nr:hypothetical protein [Flavobacterium selenitireducens]